VHWVIDQLDAIAPRWAYLVVGLLALGEAAALIGVVVPGEVAMLFGGFMASQGRVSLLPMMGCAAVGAVIGDSVGYEMGRWLGPRIESSRLGGKIGEHRWERAKRALRRGPYNVLVARFVGVLRAVVPMAAGTSGMRYRTFLAWNVVGGVAWSGLAVGAGYLAGGAYERVGTWFTIVGGVIVVVGGVVYLVRRHRRRRDDDGTEAQDRDADHPAATPAPRGRG
jgi:membrane protein DedA with SNARE-associated domain